MGFRNLITHLIPSNTTNTKSQTNINQNATNNKQPSVNPQRSQPFHLNICVERPNQTTIPHFLRKYLTYKVYDFLCVYLRYILTYPQTRHDCILSGVVNLTLLYYSNKIYHINPAQQKSN